MMLARKSASHGPAFTGPTDEEFETANLRGMHTQMGPCAVSATYDPASQTVRIDLDTGAYVGVPVSSLEGLAGADPAKLANIVVEKPGLGLHWPDLDADLYVPALLEGIYGSRTWMAARMGAAGGSAKSEAKAASARLNGKKGGRPRKS